MSSKFSKIQEGKAPTEAFILTKAYLEDTSPNKANLSAGVYRTEELQPWVLPVVRQVEKSLAADETLNKEYLPILGLETFCTATTAMLLGSDSPALLENRAFGVQSISGTGALRVGSEFLVKVLGCKVVYYSNPTWENHHGLFKCAGFTDVREYRYWNNSVLAMDLKGFLEDLRNAPRNSVIILHACAHNPTGCDPTEEEWEQIVDVMQERELFPFFDSAYQGFVSGDFEKDTWAVRYFVARGLEVFCAQSFAKNFGLYSERVGNLTVILNNASYVPQVKSQLTLIVRGMYSNPPSHGARIVAAILSDPRFYKQWQENVRTIVSRFTKARHVLHAALERLHTPGNWSHITLQIGMFVFTGLNARQSEHMVKKHHVYIFRSGRINLCGITESNVDYIAKAIHETITNAM